METETDSNTPPPSRRRNILATLKGLGFTMLVLATLWIALRYVLTPLVISGEPSPPAAIESDYEERIKRLENKVAALEKAPPAETSATDTTPLEARIAALEQAPVAPVTALPPLSAEALEVFKSEMEKLKTANHTTLRSVILVNQLQDAVQAGRPFAKELATLKALRPDLSDTLSISEAHAATGIATPAQLQEQFQRSIHTALNSNDEQKDLLNNLRSLVKIRKVGGAQKGADDEAVIARAEALLAKRDIAGALQETGNLSPYGNTAFTLWKKRAEDYLNAQGMLEKLQANVTPPTSAE